MQRPVAEPLDRQHIPPGDDADQMRSIPTRHLRSHGHQVTADGRHAFDLRTADVLLVDQAQYPAHVGATVQPQVSHATCSAA